MFIYIIIFNDYKGYKVIFVDGADNILYSEDGCTQGDPIAMLLYGVGVKPLFGEGESCRGLL